MFTRRHFEHGRNHRDDPPAEEGAAGSPFSSDYRQHPRGSNAVPGQLSDETSKLSRFLLRGVEASDMESMGDINAAWYALGEVYIARESRRTERKFVDLHSDNLSHTSYSSSPRENGSAE